MSIDVVLVDDHELIRQGLRRAFERTDDFTVVGEAGSVSEGLRVVGETPPDVVVTDVRLPDGSGFELARHLRSAHDTLGVVVLTMYGGDETLLEALHAGASAYVTKDCPSTDVIAAARQAATSPRSFAAKDLAGALQRRTTALPVTLSNRETEILTRLADGQGVSRIARELYISESTAKTHVARLYEKLGASNRAQALMSAVRAGLLPDVALGGRESSQIGPF